MSKISEKEQRLLDLAKRNSFSDDDIELFENFLEYLKQKKKISKDMIPTSIFDKRLAPLEAVVKYLRENCEYSYNEIALLLNRNAGPIGVSYRNAKKKFSSGLDLSSDVSIPVSIFKDSKLTVFESIVVYLKESGFKFKKIAELLNRNYRTIWTVYSRAKKR